jgi:hypothetical protein
MVLIAMGMPYLFRNSAFDTQSTLLWPAPGYNDFVKIGTFIASTPFRP